MQSYTNITKHNLTSVMIRNSLTLIMSKQCFMYKKKKQALCQNKHCFDIMRARLFLIITIITMSLKTVLKTIQDNLTSPNLTLFCTK